MGNTTTKLLFARYEDCLRAASKNGRAFLGFLSDVQCQALEKYRLLGLVGAEYMFWGGAEDCERKYLAIFRGELVAEDFPIVALKFSCPNVAQLSHRDFLGSIVAEGIAREAVGDIFFHEDAAVVLVSQNVVKALLGFGIRVGRYKADVQQMDCTGLRSVRKFLNLSVSVASIRLDAVVAELTNLSRADAKGLVEAGFVRVGMDEAPRANRELQPGEILSVRGYGKYIFDEIVGKTRRERFRLGFRKYI